MTITKLISTSLTLTVIAIIAVTQPALADIEDAQAGCGQFAGNGYILEVTRTRNGNGYRYSMKKFNSKGLELLGGQLTTADGKHYYRWNNKGVLYQVTWNPNDSQYARVQAFNRGKRVFNQLFEIGNAC